MLTQLETTENRGGGVGVNDQILERGPSGMMPALHIHSRFKQGLRAHIAVPEV
jgi:hypothetical protein